MTAEVAWVIVGGLVLVVLASAATRRLWAAHGKVMFWTAMVRYRGYQFRRAVARSTKKAMEMQAEDAAGIERPSISGEEFEALLDEVDDK